MDYKTNIISGVCSVVTDGSHYSPKSVNEGCYMVSVKDFTEYGFDFSGCRKISEQDYEALKKSGCVPEYGDILIGKDGARYFEDIIIYRQPEKPALLSSIAILRCNKDEILPEYLYYLLKTPSFKKDVKDNYGSGSAIPRIILKDFKRMPIRYPALSQQKKIVSVLEAIDKKIQINIKINDNLQQQLATIYKSWYQDFSLVANEELVETEYGLIPKGWHYAFLGDLCKSISVTHKFDKEELIFLNTGDIENGRFLHSNFMSVKEMPGQAKKTIAPGDILYSEIRPINRHFAFVNFPSADYVVSTKLMVIRTQSFDSMRLYHYLTSDSVLAELQLQAESRSGTFPQIRFDNVSRLPILIADKQTEKVFIDLLHTVYAQIEHINRENEKLTELRDNLLPKLMSGEIDVSDIQL